MVVQMNAIWNKFKRMLKFTFVASKRLNELLPAQVDYTQLESKRGIIKRLNAPLTILGMIIVIGLIFVAIFAPWLTPYSYQDLRLGIGQLGTEWKPPSLLHVLGTTTFGRDVLGRILFGVRTSLTMGLEAVLISLVLGVLIGLVSAYSGGWIDNILMRIMDILLAFPSLILAIVFISVFVTPAHPTPSVSYIILAFGILGIPYYARLIRGSVLSVKQNMYIESARVSGASSTRIMFRHILVNCMSPIIVSFSFDIGGVILDLAAISFLGFGDPTMIEWGKDLLDAQVKIINAPWATIFPGIAILITVLGFMLLGDGLRDALDPRLKNL